MISRISIWRASWVLRRKRRWVSSMELIIDRAAMEGYDVTSLSGRVSEALVAISAVEVELRLMSLAVSRSSDVGGKKLSVDVLSVDEGILKPEALTHMRRRKVRTW